MSTEPATEDGLDCCFKSQTETWESVLLCWSGVRWAGSDGQRPQIVHPRNLETKNNSIYVFDSEDQKSEVKNQGLQEDTFFIRFRVHGQECSIELLY